jgi:hypothetical protein
MVTLATSRAFVLAMVFSAAVVVSVVVALTTFSKTGSAATSCTGKQVYPGANLASVAAGTPSGTTFCVHDGTYSVSQSIPVTDGDRFIGVYQDSTRPIVKTTSARIIFNASGSNRALIQDLSIEGAVGDKSCQPNCGRGISGGANLTVANVRATLNKNQGIGGTGAGLLVKNSEIDHNGSSAFAQQTNGETAAGIKSANPMNIQNSYIHDNYWAGVWCDDNCGTMRVQGSRLINNGKAGIHTEISVGPQVISGNTIKGNGHFESWSLEAGLLINSVRDVDVYNNVMGNNLDHGIRVVEDSRWPVTSGVSIHDNTMNGDLLGGCFLSGVSCHNNR